MRIDRRQFLGGVGVTALGSVGVTALGCGDENLLPPAGKGANNEATVREAINMARHAGGLEPAAKPSLERLVDDTYGRGTPESQRALDFIRAETRPAPPPVKEAPRDWEPGFAVEIVHADLRPDSNGVINQDRLHITLGPPSGPFNPFVGDTSGSTSLGREGEVIYAMDVAPRPHPWRPPNAVLIFTQSFVLRELYDNDAKRVPPGARVATLPGAEPERQLIQVSADEGATFHTVGVAGETLGDGRAELFLCPPGVVPRFVRIVDQGGGSEVRGVQAVYVDPEGVPAHAVRAGKALDVPGGSRRTE